MPASLRLILAFFLSLNLSAHAADWLYLTVPGDTLIGIGKQYLKNPRDWPKIQSANNVTIPKYLRTNTRLKIPVKLLKVTPASVTVTAVGGNVRFKGAEGGYQRLEANNQLNGGETVLTGPRSSVSYRFADGTALTQQASSKLTFGRLAAYGKTGMVSTELNLESGRLEARATRQLAPAGGFRVRTPVAVAGLRGTGFRLNVAEDGKRMSNEVLEGAVAVSAQGKAVNVAAGFGTYAEAGKPPVPPRALLPAPDLSGLAGKFQRLPLQFTKPPQPGAVAWRAQIATDASFGTVLLDDVFTGPTAQWREDLPDGAYVLRARAIDDAGLEGLDSTHAFTLDARPLPPLPLAPALGERLYQTQANFSWTAVADAHGYALQIAPTPEFKHGLIERRLPPVVQHQETLGEGEWHWRLASLDEAGQMHQFSPHRAFRIQPLPVPPAGGQGQVGDGQVHFTWGTVHGADSYGREVSKDSTVVINKAAKDAALAAPLEPGKYHWRVRGLEADGQAGGWSGSNVVILPPRPPHDLKVDVKAKPMSLAWKGEAPRYRVEIALDPAFAKVSTRLETDKPEAALKDLEPGDYVVRVMALGSDGVNSLPSQPVSFTVERAKPWWLLLLPFLAL